METAAIYAGVMAFLSEMVAPLVLCSSIPLGSPPVQDPALGRMAPTQCVLYLGWAGIGTPDAKSANRAERFLADPEIRHMRAEAARRFHLMLKSNAAPGSSVGDSQLSALTAFIPTSLISDDAGIWCDLLATQPCAGFISRIAVDAKAGATQVHGAFVMNVGDAGPKVAAMLKHYRELAKDMILESTIDGCIEYRLKISDSPPATAQLPPNSPPPQEAANGSAADQAEAKVNDPHLRWTLRGEYLIVTWGDESPAEIVKRMKGPEPDWLIAVAKDVPIERRAAIVRVDLEAFAACCAAGDADCQESAKQIRNTHVRAVALVTGLGHDDFVSQVLVETDGVAAALLKTMADRPLKAEDMAVIPRDATLAMALRVNPNLIATGLRWLDAQEKESKESGKEPDAAAEKNADGEATQNTIDVTNLIRSMAPGGTAQDAITRLCRKPTIGWLDNELCDELTASIGDAWRVYTSPSEGSSIFNGMTAVVRVKDAGRLTKLFDKLAARKTVEKVDAKAPESGNSEPGAWAVRKVRFAEHDVYYLVRAQGESAGVLTWCLLDSELVCSLSPQNVKAYLLRQPGGSSLAEEPAVVEAFQTKQTPTLLMYEDSRRMFQMTYPMMQGWATVAAGQAGLPTDGIDPMLLPASPTIAKYLQPAVSMVSIVPKGVQLTIHQSLPNGNLGATLYCVLCSLLPENAGTVVKDASPPFASALPARQPCDTADPCGNTGELKATPASPVATPSVPNAADAPAIPTATPAYAASSTGYATTTYPNNSAAARQYPSTSTPEPFRLPCASTPNTNVPVPYFTPYGGVPTAPPNVSAPAAGAAPASPNPAACSPVPIKPSTAVANTTVVYVPMVIYVPMVYTPGSNPPMPYGPMVYPPPGLAPPSSTPRAYPAPAYPPPVLAPQPGDYAPRPVPARTIPGYLPAATPPGYVPAAPPSSYTAPPTFSPSLGVPPPAPPTSPFMPSLSAPQPAACVAPCATATAPLAAFPAGTCSPLPYPGVGQSRVLLYFYSDACGVCREMSPVVQTLNSCGYTVRRMDVTYNPPLAKKYNVRSIPCFVMEVDGREVDRVVGKTSMDRLQQMCRANASVASPCQAAPAASPAYAPPTYAPPPPYTPARAPSPPAAPCVPSSYAPAPSPAPPSGWEGWDPYAPPSTTPSSYYAPPSPPCSDRCVLPQLAATSSACVPPPAVVPLRTSAPASRPALSSPRAAVATAPDFAELTGKKVAVVCRPTTLLLSSNANVGRELAQQLSLLLKEQTPKIKIVDQRKIAKWTDENCWSEYPEVGKAVKADMIVGIDLESFTLYAGQTLYQGKANVTIRVFDCKKDGKEVFRKSIPQYLYPPSAPVPASERSEAEFRNEFVSVLANQIARCFVAQAASAGFGEDAATLK